MKVKRIKRLTVNSFSFTVRWTAKHNGASFSYGKNGYIEIGTRDASEQEIFHLVCHELWEIVAIEMGVRMRRPDCDTDYIFVYDHRQHETMCNMFAALVAQFLE